VPSLAATQIQLSTMRRQLDASQRTQKTAKPSHSAEDRPAAPARSADARWTSPGRRERAAAALLTVVIALVAGTFGVVTAVGHRNDARHAQAAAQGFPAAVDLAVSIQREAANWAPDQKAERTAARAHTDTALHTLTADVSRLPASARGPSQAKLQELASLSEARQVVDTLNKNALPEYAAFPGAEDQVDNAYASIQNDARSISTQLADLIRTGASDSAALALVDAASASTQSAFATADLSRIDLGLISGRRTLNVDTTAARAEAAAQAEVQLDRAGALVTDQAGTRDLAAVHDTDDQLRNSSTNLLARAENPEVAATYPDAYSKLMTGRIDRMRAAADVEIQAFSDQEASTARRALNEIIACIGLTLIVVLAAILGIVRPRGGRPAPVPAGSSPDLAQSTPAGTNDLFTPANLRHRVGTSDV
jgi:hypothetical protein